MAEKKIQIVQCLCERCSHDWIPRRGVLPLVCPKCKSPYWNRAREN